MWNLIGGFAFIAISIGGVIAGFVTKQPALLIAGGCFVALGIVALVKGFRHQLSGPTMAGGRPDDKFVLADVSGSPGIFALCVVLFVAAAGAFAIFPPTHAYW